MILYLIFSKVKDGTVLCKVSSDSPSFVVADDTYLAPPIKPHRAHPQSRGGTSANKGSLGGELLGHGRSRQR